jgi:DNA transformation protein
LGERGARYSDDVGELAAEVVEALSPLGEIGWRKMFGGAGLFADGSMFALIDSAARLHFKVDESTRGRYEQAASEQHARMPYYSVPDHVLAEDDALLAWARESIAVSKP